jgi:hypothetical protein
MEDLFTRGVEEFNRQHFFEAARHVGWKSYGWIQRVATGSSIQGLFKPQSAYTTFQQKP